MTPCAVDDIDDDEETLVPPRPRLDALQEETEPQRRKRLALPFAVTAIFMQCFSFTIVALTEWTDPNSELWDELVFWVWFFAQFAAYMYAPVVLWLAIPFKDNRSRLAAGIALLACALAWNADHIRHFVSSVVP